MLDITRLRVSYGENEILKGIDLILKKGESIAVIGESGVGKTTLGLSTAGLVQGKVTGKVYFNGVNILELPEKELNSIRWNSISLVLQNVEDVLNPAMSVIDQVVEPMVEHGLSKKRQAQDKAKELISKVGLEDSRSKSYPHQLSGGERQRAMIAMALANDPDLIILDEPTASLDSLSRADILKLLKEIEKNRALMIITHDISAAAKISTNLAVLYGGKLVEKGPTARVIRDPHHPYTRGLLRSYPNMATVKDLQGIKGRMELPEKGCLFYPRCTQAVDTCKEKHPKLEERNGRYLACHRGGIVPLLEGKRFYVNYGNFNAVRGTDIRVCEGETVAVVGESGSGKSSLAFSLMGIIKEASGDIYLDGLPIKKRDKHFYRRVQMIFQNPGDSISHRHNVLQAVQEPLDIQKLGCYGERKEKVRRALDEVQLPSDDEFLARYPHHLSGGERQRVAIARALVLQPAVIIADEPTSALDASVQAKILKLFLELQQNRGLGIIFISHDIASARKISDRIVVMKKGEILEEGPAEQVIYTPQNPYTQALLEAAPSLDVMSENTSKGHLHVTG